MNLSASALVFTSAPSLAPSNGANPDFYTVSLTVTDTSGATATASSTFGTVDPANDMVTTAQDTMNIAQGVSLREAIDVQYTSQESGFYAITFAPSLAYQTITLSSSDDTTDHGYSALEIRPNERIDINATSVPGITITAAESTPGYGPTRRLFYVAPNAILALQGLTLSGGIAFGSEDQATGGAVYVDTYSTLFLENCTVMSNTAYGGQPSVNPGPGHPGTQYGADGRGGAIFVNSNGNLVALNDTITGNTAETSVPIGPVYYGYGAVYNFGGSAYGGAIYNNDGGMVLSNDTIVGNAVFGTTGLYAGATPQAAGILETSGAVSFIDNTILALNNGGADYQALGSVTTSGSSDIMVNPGPGTPSGYDSIIANPLLGPLADHGHGVLTYSLLPGSPALGSGNSSETYSAQFDGRGLPRVDSSGKVDIGAFEHQPYIVSNTNDGGPGSLRAAIAADDDNSPIQFGSNLAGQTILLTSGPLVITRNLTLTGLGANQLQIESVAGAAAPVAPADLYKGEGNASDSAGSANGTPVGGVTYAAGEVGEAFQFNGTNIYITIPPSADVVGTGAFAVSAWIKTGSDGLIIQQRDASNFNGEYVLAVVGGKINFWDFGNSEYGFNMTSNESVANNQWHYIVAVRLANGTGQIYIDGQLDSTLAGNVVPIGSNVNVYIGADYRNIVYGYPPEYFNGLIDEVAIDHSAPSALQIEAAYGASAGGRVFTIEPGVTATVTGLTIAGGVASSGGGILNMGNLTIANSVLSSNVAQGVRSGISPAYAAGGAIDNATGAVLTVTGSTFLANSAIGIGGIASATTIGGSGRGGAIYNASGAQLYLADDTFSANSASAAPGNLLGYPPQFGGFGGAIDNAGSAYILNTTIAQSSVTAPTIGGIVETGGAGIENESGATLGLVNTIVARDTGANDVSNVGTAAGDNNLVMTSDGLPAGVVSVTADPQLEGLSENGGTTLTYALAPTSPAVGAGSTGAVLPAVSSGLADWWKAEGNALDAAGNASGTVNGGVTYAPGIAGEAFDFNGANGYIAIPPSADFVGTGAFTVSAWIKTTSDGLIIQQRDASNFNGEYVLAVVGGKINFWDYGNSEYGFNFSSNETVTDGKWHSIVAVRLAGGTGEIYIDGNLDNTQAGPAVPIGSNVNIYIGADYRDLVYGYPPEYFNGLIDEVQIYHRALSASDVQTGYVFGPAQNQAAYNASAAPATLNGLAGFWSGNGNALDSTGRDPGSTTSGVSYTAGQSGQAFQLNGQGGEVTIPDTNLIDTSSFSVGGWFELTRAPAAGNEFYLASKYNGNGNGWIIRVESNLTWGFSIARSSSAAVTVSSSNPLPLNTMFYLAATYDGNTASIYVDGVLAGRAALSGGYAYSTSPLVLGAASWFSGGYTPGLIQDFSYYSRALSPDEVQALYFNAGGLPTVDQRGFSRVESGQVDIGSFEVQPFVVTSTADSGRGSLRQAVADDVSGDEPIEFAAGLAGQTITLLSPIQIAHNLTITGPGGGEVTISGGKATELFNVESGAVSISGVTLANGLAAQGGAIANSGNLTISNGTFSNNLAQNNPSLYPNLNSAGGAILNLTGATLVVTGSTFNGNEAKGVAGSGNNASGYGGAIENTAGATFIGTSDTFDANSAIGGTGGGGFGGAIDNAGTATVVDSTILENSVAKGAGTPPTPSTGAGINNQAGGTLAISNTIESYDTGGNDLTSAGTVSGPDIVGLPTTGPAGAPITLTGISAGAGTGANNVWTISSGPGEQVIAGQDLAFTGSNPIALPSGLISAATTLTVNVAFSTTGDGVILGSQDQPLGVSPANFAPALYVGTDGYLRGGISGFATFQSFAPVNDGQTHDVVLSINGSTMTVTIDGAQVAQTSGSNNSLEMTFDQIGTGYASTLPGGSSSGAFPFSGTISSLAITQGAAFFGAVAPSSSSVNQFTFTPPVAGIYSVGLSSINSSGLSASTAQTFTATDVAPAATLSGLPASCLLNQGYTLVASVTDPVPSDTVAGFNNVWSASAGPGQQAVVASNLVFNGSNPVALPSGLIHNATSLAISVTFATTGDGVILAYQDQPLGSTPVNWVPMLYIGTNGHLYFEFFNGSSQPIESATQLNDGQLHTVTIQWSGSVLSFTLDSETSGTISSFSPLMLNMTYDELGTGYAGNYPAASNGYFPFTGTISNLTITAGTALLGALRPNLSAGGQASFTPLNAGTYTIGLSSTDVLGSTGTASQSFTTQGTIPLPTITGLPTSSPEGTAVTLTGSATETNATVAALGFSYLWQAADANAASATGSGALSFNGTSQFVDLGNPGDLNFSGQVTMDAWIMPESTAGLQDIIAHGYQTSPTNAEDFLRISGGYYQVGSWNGNNAFAQVAIPAGDIGQWVNLAGVYNGTQWILYRDGVQVATSGPTSQGALAVSSTDWAIGSAGSGKVRFFQGEIDDASIWNVGLSAAGVESVMATTPSVPESGLVAYYPFDETGGNVAKDATGNGNNGTLGGISSNTLAADPSRVAGIVLGSKVTVTPGESGVETLTLQAFDAAGGTGVVTRTFTASPIPIIVNAGGNAVVQQGTLLTRTCSFTDPAGDGPWTATVIYGDGTPAQPLVVNGQSFTLSHIFENAGTFVTVVTVTNRLGVSGSFSYTATVSGFTVNDGSPGPQPVTRLTYTFNNPSLIDPGAFVLYRNGERSKIHMIIAPQPDGQTYLITFRGPGVIDGGLPDGHYRLVTLRKKVKVLSGPRMTANDVNTFNSRAGHAHRGTKGKEHSTVLMDPPRKAPPKFPGRTVQQLLATHRASAAVRAAVARR